MLSNPNLDAAVTDQPSSMEAQCNVLSDENQENNPRSNIQVCEGQIVLASESSPAVMEGSPAQNDWTAINDSPSRRQLDVCEGQIILK